MGKKRLTTEEFIEKARLKHGNLYSYEKVNYVNNSTKVIITCHIHGDFLQTPAHHMNGTKCPLCFGSIKYNFETLHSKINLKHNGEIELLPNQVIDGVERKYKFRHKCGHEWLAKAGNILNGKSCPKCGNNVSYDFETLCKAINLKHNGEIQLINDRVINGVRFKYRFKHSCGYEWETTANAILNGRSCPKCARNIPYDFDSMNLAIKNKHDNEIELLPDQEIKGNSFKYKFRHVCGNIWESQAASILAGTGCPKCAISGFKTDLPAVLYILKINGNFEFTGFGISNKYKQRKTQHKKNLKTSNCSIISETLIHSDGITIQKLEQYIKQTLNCNNSLITGFRTESVLISPEELKDFCIKWLDKNNLKYSVTVK